MKNLIKRIKQAENKYYPPIDVRTLSDEELEKVVADYRARFPKQSAAYRALYKSLSDEELIAIRDGRHYLLSMDTRRRLKHADQTKG